MSSKLKRKSQRRAKKRDEKIWRSKKKTVSGRSSPKSVAKKKSDTTKKRQSISAKPRTTKPDTDKRKKLRKTTKREPKVEKHIPRSVKRVSEDKPKRSKRAAIAPTKKPVSSVRASSKKLTPAQRAWETRRAREIQKQIEHEARSLRAKKGWETRRFRDLQRQHKERTLREKEIDRQRKSTEKAKLKWEAVRGAIKFGTDELDRKAIVDMIAFLKSQGIRAFRFVRQVPATPSYPKGVASTQWLDLKSYDKKAINNLIGSMMQPGIDFVRHMLILDSDVPKLPPPMRDRAFEAIAEAGREVRKSKPRTYKKRGRDKRR